jgi:hypothetical protein
VLKDGWGSVIVLLRFAGTDAAGIFLLPRDAFFPVLLTGGA